MNVEVEILDLQLRLQALETRSCSGSHDAVLAGLAAARAEIVDVRSGVSQDFEILNFEIARLRKRFDEGCSASLLETMTMLEGLRFQLNDLGLRLDRLLAKDDA
ncbi:MULTISPECIES: hypothetical protein [unclassified Nonomuraea]|uniref:hypothetical protein n=1 Tax=unclassified Nonomuraea TaxID=2593643 RepID=UPI00340D692C